MASPSTRSVFRKPSAVAPLSAGLVVIVIASGCGSSRPTGTGDTAAGSTGNGAGSSEQSGSTAGGNGEPPSDAAADAGGAGGRDWGDGRGGMPSLLGARGGGGGDHRHNCTYRPH